MAVLRDAPAYRDQIPGTYNVWGGQYDPFSHTTSPIVFKKDWTRAFGGAITGEYRRKAKCRCWRPHRLEARLST
jgi:hypothetical protein